MHKVHPPYSFYICKILFIKLFVVESTGTLVTYF